MVVLVETVFRGDVMRKCIATMIHRPSKVQRDARRKSERRTAQAVASMYFAGGPVHRCEVGPHSMKLVVDATLSSFPIVGKRTIAVYSRQRHERL